VTAIGEGDQQSEGTCCIKVSLENGSCNLKNKVPTQFCGLKVVSEASTAD
jgi:hypothetical protein